MTDRDKTETGRIVSRPDPLRHHRCTPPRAGNYERATVWECDDCKKQWVVVVGAQYNELYTAWRLLTGANANGVER